jgi:hypothetical protein
LSVARRFSCAKLNGKYDKALQNEIAKKQVI